MAADKGAIEPDEEEQNGVQLRNGQEGESTTPTGPEDKEDEEDEEEEPRLKYAPLTKHLPALYRNGDASSSFLVAGDKMVGIAFPEPSRND